MVANETSCLVINNYYALPVKTKFGGKYVYETPMSCKVCKYMYSNIS